MTERRFRRPESLDQERVTRDMIPRFLAGRGLRVEEDRRERQGQTVHASLPNGSQVVMRVKLCWRRGADGRNQERHSSYSAAQLMARVENGDWMGSIEGKMDREVRRGTTHLLLVQRDGDVITRAALVPISEIATIWARQRDVSESLTRAGALGRRHKNHAMNGHSPTLWLQDDRGGQAVADALWSHPGVVDLVSGELDAADGGLPEEVVYPERYIEGACHPISVNAYERDRKARRKCVEWHGTRCVVCGFSFGATYGEAAEGHIHVHHLRPIAQAGGSYVVDPVEDLRPVCANCHSIIHLRGQCRSIEEVQQMFERASRGRPNDHRN
jgi:5-methylcytosine-specific restriction protein A